MTRLFVAAFLEARMWMVLAGVAVVVAVAVAVAVVVERRPF